MLLKTRMFGERLKNLLKYRNITQAELAEKTNISTQRISNYIVGRTEPDIESITKICNILNVPADYFFSKIELEDIDYYNAFFSKWRPLYEKVKSIANEKRYQVYSASRGKLLFREAKDYILGPDAVILGFEDQIESTMWYNDYVKGNISEFEYWRNLCEWLSSWKEKLERDISK